ncbi:hypothetical protein BDY24DRAFT_128574 [Mrakia frigida]|uniref:uncharacterized protein n=1 Tax=Mrakia frigida TaxID=29902 RepID=UPI003FCC1490
MTTGNLERAQLFLSFLPSPLLSSPLLQTLTLPPNAFSLFLSLSNPSMSDPTPPPAESSEPSPINPTCSKCSIELIGKRSVCSGCSRSPYCSVECQTLVSQRHS